MQVACCGYVLTAFLPHWAAPAGKCVVKCLTTD